MAFASRADAWTGWPVAARHLAAGDEAFMTRRAMLMARPKPTLRCAGVADDAVLMPHRPSVPTSAPAEIAGLMAAPLNEILVVG